MGAKEDKLAEERQEMKEENNKVAFDRKKKKHHPATGNLVFAFNTCREKVMRRERHGGREEEREGR